MAFEQYLPQPPNYQLVESANLWLDLFGTSNPEVAEDPKLAVEGQACLVAGQPAAIHKIETVTSRKRVNGQIVYFERQVSHYLRLTVADELGRKFVCLYSSFSDQLT